MPAFLSRRRAGLALGTTAAVAAAPHIRTIAGLLRAMVAPTRQPLRSTPAHVGLPYEAAFFTSYDGVPLRGWFIPRPDPDKRPAPAVLFLHGWPWNRLGNAASHPLAPGVPNQSVDLLAPATALHRANFH